MRGATRYILRELALPLVLVTITLTGVVWLTQGLRFIDMIVNVGLSAWTFLELTLLLLPTALVYILPLSLLCAILFTYHRLNADSELIVMRAAGLSPRALAAPALLCAAIVGVLLYAVTLYVMPAGMRTFKGMQFSIRHDYAALLLKEGVFNTLTDGLTVYVRERRSGGELLGILVHDSRVADRPVTMMAERGMMIRTPEGPRFVLVGGNRQEVAVENGRLSMLYFDRYMLDLEQYTRRSNYRWLEPSERYLHELIDPGDTPDDVNNADKMRIEIHRRLLAPLYCFAFALIAVAALLSGELDRRGQWRRVVAAVIAAITLQLIGLLILQLAARAPSLIVLAYLNLAAACVGSLYVLSGGGRRWRVARWSAGTTP